MVLDPTKYELPYSLYFISILGRDLHVLHTFGPIPCRAAAPKLGIGPNVTATDQVQVFLDSAVKEKLTDLYVGTKAIHAAVPELLARFGGLRVLK